MAMENVNGETRQQCREDCIQGCATTGALPSKCLQNCYRGCRGLPSPTEVLLLLDYDNFAHHFLIM
ncbi:hypothetical protein Bca4012_056368 [Brassica carinata]|uniref:Uncharacterized protein n=1 Tax=Brassica carinata TaxID=52824 RepID=A0A8X7W1N1_BRACI|nr:hypothetical protein Bca52824_013808 [Brassica carinata]